MNTITDDQIAEIELDFQSARKLGREAYIDMQDGEALIARLREAERDAARYRFIREVASGAPEDFEVVADAAFVAAYGCDHNFDLNIDAAMQESEQ